MFRRFGTYTIALAVLTTALSAQGPSSEDLAGFHARLERYAEMHRRLEGPLPPIAVTADIGEVHRLMDALRARIRAERRAEGQGHLLSPQIVRLLRERIAGCMTVDEIRNTMADIDEHVPPTMPPPRVNEPLPEDAPFGMVPPQALKNLPALPPELRYMVLSNALLIWDHHADLIVDIAPGLFDADTYVTKR